MVKLISECDKELRRIDSDLERLHVERKRICTIRALLRGHIPYNHVRFLLPRLLAIIEAHPGINGKGIRVEVDGGYTGRQITNALSKLRSVGEIENRGSNAQCGRWYIKEN